LQLAFLIEVFLAVPIVLNISCNSECTKWCPRALKVLCCCYNCEGDEEPTLEEKTDTAALNAIQQKRIENPSQQEDLPGEKKV
jgi:hypothetical protein